jgi:cell division protein FtsN
MSKQETVAGQVMATITARCHSRYRRIAGTIGRFLVAVIAKIFIWLFWLLIGILKLMFCKERPDSASDYVKTAQATPDEPSVNYSYRRPRRQRQTKVRGGAGPKRYRVNQYGEVFEE